MENFAEQQGRQLLEQVMLPLKEAGFSSRSQSYEGSNLDYQVLVVADPHGEEDVAIDVRPLQIGPQGFLLLQYKCALISSIEEGLLPELKVWLEQANILTPLGSLLLVGEDLLMRYSLLCPLEQLPSQPQLDAATSLFFMERIIYADIAISLLTGQIELPEAIRRLQEGQASL